MSSTWITAHMDTSDHGLLHPFEGSRVAANGLTAIKKVLMRCVFIFKQLNKLEILSAPTDKNLKNWGQVNVGAMQLVLLYLSILHDRYDWVHVTQVG
jgi:hypothetical protein